VAPGPSCSAPGLASRVLIWRRARITTGSIIWIPHAQGFADLAPPRSFRRGNTIFFVAGSGAASERRGAIAAFAKPDLVDRQS
jgi:hypothetical protein